MFTTVQSHLCTKTNFKTLKCQLKVSLPSKEKGKEKQIGVCFEVEGFVRVGFFFCF